jgi:hypothetical protein
MSVNKHYCQGTYCHEKTTQDRFQKSTGMLRGRYAYHNIGKHNYYKPFQIFCSQGCANDWLSEHTEDIINQRPIKFITERRTTSGYEMQVESHSYGTYKTINKINSQNS